MMKLYTSDETFRGAHLVAGKGRKTSVTIRRSTLLNLLMDHSRMVEFLERRGEQIEKGKPDGDDARSQS